MQGRMKSQSDSIRKIFYLCFLLVLLPFTFVFAQQEEITLTAYYPSPYGVYGELAVVKPGAPALFSVRSTGDRALISLQSSGGSGNNWGLASETNGNFRIIDQSAGQERFIILPNGRAQFTENVGIQTAPVANYALKIKGPLRITEISSGSADGNISAENNISAATFTYTSDRRYKQNIRNIDDGLDKILQLEGVYFERIGSGKNDMGLVAQDVERVFPEIVRTDSDGFKYVDYAKIVAPLIGAVKTQQEELEKLRQEITELRALDRRPRKR